MVVVVMRRHSCDDFDTQLVRCLLYFRWGVRVHGGRLIRVVVYDEIRVVVLSDWDWNDPHVVVVVVVVRLRGVECSLCCGCDSRPRPAEQRPGWCS